MLGKNKPQKPIGVYIGSMLIILSYGIMPFAPTFKLSARETWILAYGALPFNGSLELLRDSNGETPLLIVSITLFLCIFTAASAMWMLFSAHSEARYAVLAFTSLDYLWWAFLSVMAITSKDTLPGTKFELSLSLVFPTGIIGIIWWYFTKKDVVAYYKNVS